MDAAGFCAQVPAETAQQVAKGVLGHHLALFGHWNGSLTPTLGDVDAVRYDDQTAAFNYQVRPSGHVLVIVEDELSPVPLYSTTSAFVPGRSDNANAIESWIVPELNGRVRGVRDFQSKAGSRGPALTQSAGRSRIKQAWAYFRGLSGETGSNGTSRSLAAGSGSDVRGAVVNPLLTTAWGQASPYNLQTPGDAGCTHTLTGCVATAWAQLVHYWKWPIQGQDSHSYEWTGDGGNETLSADFEVAYDWANMPAVLADSSSQTQKDAVALLMYHLGVAAEMEFGCDISGSWSWADEVLGTYFHYKAMTPQANRVERENYSAAQWFALFKAELDADPPRPVIFTIFSTSGGGHEVVVDGYQQGPADSVHINFGWEGSYDGYYDIADDDDFNTPPYDWYVNLNQVAVVGIEPDNTPPSVDAGSDQNADEGTEVQLSGSATDPEGIGISSYLWTQISGTAAVIANAGSVSATITTPHVHGEALLEFQLRAADANRAFGTDTVFVTVSNTDGSVAPAPAIPSAGGSSGIGSSGGCFVMSMDDRLCVFR